MATLMWTSLETGVLGKLLAGDDSVLAVLRAQLDVASVAKREWTGVGFFTQVVVPSTAPLATGTTEQFRISDVSGTVSGVACGFLLFVRRGVLHVLECHTWADGQVHEGAQLDEVHYVKHPSPGDSGLVPTVERDLAQLRASWQAS